MKLRNGKLIGDTLNEYIIEKCNTIIPEELTRYIVDYHHCNTCYLNDNKEEMICHVCGFYKKFKVYRVCSICDNKKYGPLINDNYSTHCKICLSPLIKLIFCDDFEDIDLRYELFNFKKVNCNECKINIYLMENRVAQY
jgi:hypothetical protein